MHASPSLYTAGMEFQAISSFTKQKHSGTRSLAQLMVAPKQCLTSMLKQAPLLKSVQMKSLGAWIWDGKPGRFEDGSIPIRICWEILIDDLYLIQVINLSSYLRQKSQKHMAIYNIHSCAMSSHFTHIFVSICTRTQPHIPLGMMVVGLVAKVPATGRSVELCHPHPGCLGECLGQLAEQRRRALQSGTQLIYIYIFFLPAVQKLVWIAVLWCSFY